MKIAKLAPWIYAAVLACSAAAGLLVSWTAIGHEIDNYAYDFVFRLYDPPRWPLNSVILAIDERTISVFGGNYHLRLALARGLELIAPARPSAVAVDIILAEPSPDDPVLERAFRDTHNLVLSSDLLPGQIWDDPIPRFANLAAAIGHVHADLDRYDAVSRDLPLEKVAGRTRRWALALETYRLATGTPITESPSALDFGGNSLQVSRAEGRPMRIRYVPPARPIPEYSVVELENDPRLAAHFAGKAVFAGVTAQTAVRDRWMTPYSGGLSMPGIEIHANAYETLANGLFLNFLPEAGVLSLVLLFTVALGVVFAKASALQSNIAAALLVIGSIVAPYLFFRFRLIFPATPLFFVTIQVTATAAAWRHFITRRSLIHAEASQARYQQAMQFVTHEMRTPLTAIQGSSELMTRYALTDEKRQQMAAMINAESKRLARMIETFLSVERLSAGEMDLKQDRFSASALVDQCVARARPLAEHKLISIDVNGLPDDEITGDRELMEYAVYNLLTNAVKYSPPETRVTVSGSRDRDEIRVWIQDQGIGMDKNEVRRVFEKFYRTSKAEQSGELGSGIGLSIVEQIVGRHGGSIAVDSTPGKGSRFTVILPLRPAHG